MEKKDREVKDGCIEKLVKLNRVAKVVKGGRRFSFSALVVVGYGDGRVGYGFGKANDVTGTIPHDITGKFKSASVLLRPAVPGTGVKAGGAVRLVCDAAGIRDILSKSLGSRNGINTVKATFDALEHMYDAAAVAKGRGKTLKEMWS